MRAGPVVEYRGETLSLIEWAARLSMTYNALHGRLFRLGWSVERAFTEPVRLRKTRDKKRRED